MGQAHYVTQEGLDKLREELAAMIAERPVISRAIAEARDKGDLSENAEYDAAREAQGMLELKISKMQDLIANAKVIDESKINTEQVQMLTKVKLKNLGNGAFQKCTNLKKVDLQGPLNKIGSNTFTECTSFVALCFCFIYATNKPHKQGCCAIGIAFMFKHLEGILWKCIKQHIEVCYTHHRVAATDMMIKE